MVQAWFRCGSDVDRNVKCNNNAFRALLKCWSIMVQVWFMHGSGVVQARSMCVWAWVGTPTAAIASSTCRSMVARQWFRRGSGVVPVRLRHGSEVSMPTYCLSGVLQGWFQYGSDVVRACFRRGSGAAQVDLTRVGTPSATIVSFTCRSTVARLWFRRGSGVVQARL